MRQVEVQIVDGPLPAAEPWRPEHAGAVVAFDGVVRPTENGRRLEALAYEVYQPMAQRQLETLAQQVVEDHGLVAIRVTHSRGRVPVGGCSFRLEVAAAHRKPAIQAMDRFIDRMKQDVPIWKSPVFADETERVEDAHG